MGAYEKFYRTGAPRTFKTPQDFLNAAIEYFEWCEQNPLTQIVYMGKDADRRELKHPRPFTLKALCLFLGLNEKWFAQTRANFQKKIDDDNLDEIEREDAKEFSNIFTRIEEICYTQKFEGAAVGFFKEALISRDLGQVDKQQSSVTLSEIIPAYGENPLDDIQ